MLYRSFFIKIFIGLVFWVVGYLLANHLTSYHFNDDLLNKHIGVDEINNLPLLGQYRDRFVNNYFLHILINNLLVAFVVSIIGFLTGGILTIAVFFWNGFNLCIIIKEAIILQFTSDEIWHGLVFHGPIEIFALLWFGTVGLDGFVFYKSLFLKNSIVLPELSRLKLLTIPFLLIIFSAYIESLLL